MFPSSWVTGVDDSVHIDRPGGQAMREWIGSQRDWLVVEYLPAYAPDLNPVEGLWANLKGVELANRACMSLEELAAAAEQGIGRVRGESELLFSFLHQAGLSL